MVVHTNPVMISERKRWKCEKYRMEWVKKMYDSLLLQLFDNPRIYKLLVKTNMAHLIYSNPEKEYTYWESHSLLQRYGAALTSIQKKMN